MEEKNTIKISLSTYFLIIAIIAIIVMGVFIYKLNNDKNTEIQKSTELQAQVNSLNWTVSDLQNKISNISSTINSNSVTENKTESSDGGDAHSKSMSYMPEEDAYYDIEKSIIKDTDTYNKTVHYDIDKDGMDELIIIHGTCEADMEINFFTYKDKEVVNLGILSGTHSVLYIMNNQNYLLKVVAHMGYENVCKISIKNNKIVEEEISSRYVPENEEYTKGDRDLFSN